MPNDLSSACLIKAGVLSSPINHSPPSDSEHWPIAAEFSFEVVFGLDGESLRTRAAVMRTHNYVKVGDLAACQRFAKSADTRFDTAKFEHQINTLERRDDFDTPEYFSAVDTLFDKLINTITAASDDLSFRRAYLWRRHNDDGANDLRKDLAAARSIRAVPKPTTGAGMRLRQIRRILLKRTPVASRLNITEQRLSSWSFSTASSKASSIADIAALNNDASDLVRELSEKISATSRKTVRNMQASSAQTIDRRGKRCLRTLTKQTMSRSREGGHYASLVSDGRVTSDKKEVATGLVKQFYAWMGGNRTFWYSDTDLESGNDAGKALRQSILTGTLTDLSVAGIPPRFKPVVDAFRRVDGASADLYDGAMDAISDEVWRRKIATTKKGTAPGLSRESIDMLAAMNPASSSLLRRTINLMLRHRRVFSQWLRRAICPIPKVPGNSDVKLSRPLTLLSVAGKLFWSILSDRITSVWREHSLLQQQQYGFRRGVGTEDPLIIATLAAEQNYDLRQPAYEVSQDIPKAFDSVARVFKSLCLKRLGVPDEFCDLFESMDTNNETVVLTAFGTSEEVLGRDGIFECKRGYAQGCTSSPEMGWNSCYDVLLSMQSTLGTDGGSFRVIGDEKGECERSTLAYADDAKYMTGGACGTSSSRRSMELKLAVAALFFDFMEITMNAEKTLCSAREFPNPQGPAVCVASTTDWCPWIYDLDVLFSDGTLTMLPANSTDGAHHICSVEHRRHAITMVPISSGYSYLGIQQSPRLDVSVSHQMIIEMVDELLERIRAVPVGGFETRFLLEQVLWAKIGYKLRFDRFAINSFKTVEHRLRQVFLYRCDRLNTRMDRDVAAVPGFLGGPGVTPWNDLIMADRLRLVQRHLDRDTTAAPSIRAAITRAQEKFGVSGPVMESATTQYDRCLLPNPAEHGWIESLIIWCSENDISLHGGLPMLGGAQHDVAITGLAHSDVDRSMLRRLTHRSNLFWASDFLLLDGCTVNTDVVHFTLPDNARSSICSLLRSALSRWKDHPMPRLAGNSSKAGDVIFIRTPLGIQLAQVSRASGSHLRLHILESATVKCHFLCLNNERVLTRRSRDSSWQCGTLIAHPTKSYRIVCGQLSTQNETIRARSDYIHGIVSTPRIWSSQDQWTDDDASSLWVPNDIECSLHISRSVRLPIIRHNTHGLISLNISAHDSQIIFASLGCMSGTPPIDNARRHMQFDAHTTFSPSFHDEVERNVRYQLGFGTYVSVVAERCTWANGINALCSENTLIASDGSYNHLDSGAWGLVLCTRDKVECFSGCANGGIGTNSSYRTEAYGILAGLRLVFVSGLAGDIKHILDNEAVSRVYQDCENRGSSLTCSQDVWDEIIWYKRAIGPRYKVFWRRGHAERRGPIVHIEDCANHLADGLAAAGYTSHVDIRHYFSHSRRWHVRMGGRRHFDDIRNSAKLHIGIRYARTYHAQHNDKRNFDVGLLRAFCVGKSTKSACGRAETTKFVHLQLATLTRLRAWGFPVNGVRCRACHRELETIQHILVSCTAPKCVVIRQKWFASLMSYRTSANISNSIHRRISLTKSGRLLYVYGKYRSAYDAFGLVTGFIPSDFGVFLRRAACSNEDSVRKFLIFFRRLCSRGLWWPLWNAIQQAHPDEDHDPDVHDDIAISGAINENNIPDDVTGYDSDVPYSASSYFDSNSDSDARFTAGDFEYDGDSDSS